MDANTTEKSLTVLDDLAMQAQMFSTGAAMNLLQLGRVLTEAKPLVEHGEWIAWVRENAHMPVRTAQQYMQAYAKFGLNNRYAQLGPSQIIKLLPMTDDEREQLLKENDVENMTTREIDSAIRAQREKLRAEAMSEAREAIARAEEQRDEAVKRAMALENREPEVPESLLKELDEKRQEVTQLTQYASDYAQEAKRLREEMAQLAQEKDEQDGLLREQQEAMNEAREELLNLKSAMARQDPVSDTGNELTLDTFGRAVREFVGIVARMPYMHKAFDAMPEKEKRGYAELLGSVEGWAAGARSALYGRSVEGGGRIE